MIGLKNTNQSFSIYTIIGARPQFIKAAAVSRAINNNINSLCTISETIIHTGQHYDDKMSKQFFLELGIPTPAINLGIGGGSHGSNTGRMIEAIEKVLLEGKPDAVLVYGDTDSTLAAGIAACKLNISILHVEAGLRSYNTKQPEEKNRKIIDHISEICFAPTKAAADNLKKEGIEERKIKLIGDVMADSARIFSNEAEVNADSLLETKNLQKNSFILSTFHRAENTDNQIRLREILKALGRAPIPVIIPLHPRTKSKISEYGLERLLDNILISEPVGFLDMLTLEKYSSLVVTDSGGMQKEAYLQGTPCVTIRDETEWLELLENEWNILANTRSSEDIIIAIKKQLRKNKIAKRVELYGDGYAANKLVDIIQVNAINKLKSDESSKNQLNYKGLN